MRISISPYYWAVLSVSALIMLFPPPGTAAEDQISLPPARKIPGLTAEDKFPNGCVDCHINMPDQKLDARFSTLMTRWNEKVEEKLLKKAQDVAPAGVILKGVHPQATESLKNIPAACITCHKAYSKKAPPFAAMVHAIHLTGGEQNHFLTIFQGECTNCHKLNPKTGVWAILSSAEK